MAQARQQPVDLTEVALDITIVHHIQPQVAVAHQTLELAKIRFTQGLLWLAVAAVVVCTAPRQEQEDTAAVHLVVLVLWSIAATV